MGSGKFQLSPLPKWTAVAGTPFTHMKMLHGMQEAALLVSSLKAGSILIWLLSALLPQWMIDCVMPWMLPNSLAFSVLSGIGVLSGRETARELQELQEKSNPIRSEPLVQIG